jgi:hypothetical protein
MDQPMDIGIIDTIRTDWSLEIPNKSTEEELVSILSNEVNRLINEDFQQLISLLYRIDINESRLKLLLLENKGSDAGRIIAWMILERQKQKKMTREMYSARENNIPDDEKW